MKKEIVVLFIGIFLMSFIVAQGQGLKSDIQNQEVETNLQKVKAGNYVGENGRQMKIQKKENNRIRLEVGGVGVDCDCNMTQDKFQNRTRLKTMLSNGRNAEIKIMPNTASETALQRLRLKNCVEEKCSIELKEVGQGEQTKLAYEMRTQRESRVFGLFKKRMQVQAQVDAETGEVIRVRKPWWAFLASESDEE